MISTIKKGKHRAKPISFGLYYDQKIIERNVAFSPDCRYSIEGEDMFDINKLFGIGYFFSHHTDSARFGWSYNKEKDKIDLSAYCYVGKERIIKKIASLSLGEWANLKIKIKSKSYIFDVTIGSSFYTVEIPFKHKKKFAFPLGVYFGGNKTAPNTMHISINKL